MAIEKSETTQNSVLQYVRKRKLVRSRDVQKRGWNPAFLQKLEQKGLIRRISRGVYAPINARFGEQEQLAIVSKRCPGAVLCLLSALQFHRLTAQAPFELWLALQAGTRSPDIDYPPLRVVRMSGLAYREGIEIHSVEGVGVKVYSAAKTVVDCFKFRSEVGLDVAIEALKEAKSRRVVTNDQLWHYAGICRVKTVIQPYMEALSVFLMPPTVAAATSMPFEKTWKPETGWQ